MKIEVSIILVSFNTKDYLSNCINSIYKNTSGIVFEIIVVDNASTDGSLEMVRSNFPDVITVQNAINKGFGAANNDGLEKAQGEYIFFLNTDTILVNNAVFILFKYVESQPQTGACGGALFNDDMTPQISFGRFPSIKSVVVEFLFQKIFPTYYSEKLKMEGILRADQIQPFEADYIVGADLFVRKSILEKSGAFDTDFFLYFEETELCFRIQNRGFINKIFPEAKIIHLCGKSIGRHPSERQTIWFEQSRVRYISKTRNKIQAVVFYLILLILYSFSWLKGNRTYWKARLKGLLSLKV